MPTRKERRKKSPRTRLKVVSGAGGAARRRKKRASRASRLGDTPVRAEKVAAARLKILNHYYSREEIRRRLAEQLAIELTEWRP
jgi:hypothetical protein